MINLTNGIQKILNLSLILVVLTCYFSLIAAAETKINLNTSFLETVGTIEAKSENLTIDSNAGTAIFSGNVEIIHGKIIMPF